MDLRLPLILASGSPRRKDLLHEAGYHFKVVTPNVLEEAAPNEVPVQLVQRLALEKARVVAQQFPGYLVLAADTIVVIDDEVLGKPGRPEAAVRMLERIAGRCHTVWGGVALIDTTTDRETVESYATIVELCSMDAQEIENYVASGEPLDKAGGYAAQGWAGQYVVSINGSYTNVVGLNMAAVYQLLRCYRIGVENR